MNNPSHDKLNALTIHLPNLSSSEQPIKRIGFPLGNAFHFPFLEHDRATFGRFAKAIRIYRGLNIRAHNLAP
jgi:hypothetical protein